MGVVAMNKEKVLGSWCEKGMGYVVEGEGEEKIEGERRDERS